MEILLTLLEKGFLQNYPILEILGGWIL